MNNETSSNLLIAQLDKVARFDGYEVSHDHPDHDITYHLKEDTHRINRLPMSELKYTTSWDWLIPVWKKFHDAAVKIVGGKGKDTDHSLSTSIYGAREFNFMQAIKSNNPALGFQELAAGLTWLEELAKAIVV
jgi:hypothetical protein